ncbi:ribonuclease H family protein, partial [Bradyrhizobium sp. 33ap4]|uniref:ribonuclease H family protein n=1 Tax=Bradyrhizobium sp. 33ap4 TaxID=3061630 RepID=UPI003977DDFF
MSLNGSARLSHRTSPTAAELHGILLALRFIESFNPAKSWIIYTDSKSGLKALQHVLASESPVDIVCDVVIAYNCSVANGHGVMLQWVPGHSGIAGNIAADAATLQAHLRTPLHKVYFTRSDAKSVLLSLRQRISEDTWASCEARTSLLFQLDPGLSFRVPPSVPRPLTTLIHRLRLNVPYSARLLHKIGKVTSPNCQQCGAVEDTERIILSCERYSVARRRLQSSLQLLDNRPFSLAKVLGP